MGYRFKHHSKPSTEIRRVFAEQVAHAVQCLRQYPDPDKEGLHSTRKDIKKLRSLLRLVRVEELKTARSQLNKELRDAGRRLSAHRDMEVLGSILENWRDLLSEKEHPSLVTAVSKLWYHFPCAGSLHQPLDPQLVQSTISRLRMAEKQLQELPMEELRWKEIRKAARMARHRLESSKCDYLSNPNDDTLHDWRKQVKNHLHHLELLKRVDPPGKKRIAQIRRLESLLGSARDLDLLLGKLWETANIPLSVREIGEVIAFAESEKEKRFLEALDILKRNKWEAQVQAHKK